MDQTRFQNALGTKRYLVFFEVEKNYKRTWKVHPNGAKREKEEKKSEKTYNINYDAEICYKNIFFPRKLIRSLRVIFVIHL